jgi:hypothetical protein
VKGQVDFERNAFDSDANGACNARYGSSVCLKKPNHWGKHFDFAGTMWTDAGARVQKEKELLEAKSFNQ